MKTKLIAVPIPAKYKWEATDKSGDVFVYTAKPVPSIEWWNQGCWDVTSGTCMQVGQGAPCTDWRNTLERIVEIEWA